MNAPIGFDGERYQCHGCGKSWAAEHRYRWWPVRVHLSARGPWRPARWHIQIGWAMPGVDVHATVLRFGPLRVVFGDLAHGERPVFVNEHDTCPTPHFQPSAGGDA